MPKCVIAALPAAEAEATAEHQSSLYHVIVPTPYGFRAVDRWGMFRERNCRTEDEARAVIAGWTRMLASGMTARDEGSETCKHESSPGQRSAYGTRRRAVRLGVG